LRLTPNWQLTERKAVLTPMARHGYRRRLLAVAATQISYQIKKEDNYE